MPGPWFTGTDLKTVVARTLKETGPDALEPYYTEQCNDAAATAYADLRAILLGKGYTMAQLDLWDDRAQFSRQQALFWLYTESVLGLNTDDKEISKLDRRKELLLSATIMINGEPVKPASTSNVGGFGGGYISERGYRIRGDTEF